MADNILNILHEEWLEARYEKQMICLVHSKRCCECNGIDISGETCKFKEVKKDVK
jgi:hypothetical protein